MSNDALILDLSANLAPVKRRSIAREAGLLLALGGVELLLLLALGAMRPDMGRVIGSTFMMWKLGSFMLLAAMCGATAIGSLSPTISPYRGLAFALALAGATIVAGAFLDPGTAGGGSIVERIAPAYGIACALSIVVLSVPMMAMMAVLMRRGASSHPEGSALAAGLAAGAWGAFVFAFCCRVDDPLYVIVWYSTACALVTAAARWLLPKGYRL